MSFPWAQGAVPWKPSSIHLSYDGTKNENLAHSGLRFAKEHIVRLRDDAGTTEERFAASPAYELEILAFEGELRGERSRLPDGQENLQTAAVTQAVLRSIEAQTLV